MSMEECEWAQYKGKDPYFSAGTRKLAQTYDVGRGLVTTDEKLLRAACRDVTGFDTLADLDPNVSTSDGYHWFAVVEFVRDGHRIAVAFPWCKDTDRKDEVGCDRSPAVYAHPRVVSASSSLPYSLLEEINSALAAKIEQIAA